MLVLYILPWILFQEKWIRSSILTNGELQDHHAKTAQEVRFANQIEESIDHGEI